MILKDNILLILVVCLLSCNTQERKRKQLEQAEHSALTSEFSTKVSECFQRHAELNNAIKKFYEQSFKFVSFRCGDYFNSNLEFVFTNTTKHKIEGVIFFVTFVNKLGSIIFERGYIYDKSLAPFESDKITYGLDRDFIELCKYDPKRVDVIVKYEYLKVDSRSAHIVFADGFRLDDYFLKLDCNFYDKYEEHENINAHKQDLIKLENRIERLKKARSYFN